MKKAKDALRKNNEEGAKLYLQSAASKRAECMRNMIFSYEYPADGIENGVYCRQYEEHAKQRADNELVQQYGKAYGHVVQC